MDKKAPIRATKTCNISDLEVARRAERLQASVDKRVTDMPAYLRPYLDQYGLLTHVPTEIYRQSKKTTSRPDLKRTDDLVFLVREEEA